MSTDLWGYGWRIAADSEYAPLHSSSLPSVGHCGNNWWGEGGCGHLALAFKNMYPDMKIAAEYDPEHNTVNHAWAYGEDGRSHDFMGTHSYHPTSWRDSDFREDVDPEDLAADMGIDYNPDEDRMWDNHEVAQAGHLINRHWLGDDDYDGDDGHYDPSRAENRGHHTAARLAMPAQDAYDDHIPHFLRKRETPPARGDFFHGTDAEYRPGDILESVRARGDQARIDFYDNQVGSPSQADWVWMHKHPDHVRDYGRNVYQVEPMDEGPWEWNHDIFSHPGDDGRYVSPRARVVRVVPHNYPFWENHKHAHRIAMPYDFTAPAEEMQMPVERNEHGHIRVHRGIVVPRGTRPEDLQTNYGLHWSTNEQISQALADPAVYGEGDDDIGLLMSGWYDPAHGTHPDPDPITGGQGYNDHEQEITMKPGTPVHVDQVRWKHPDWNYDRWEDLDWSPRHVTANNKKARTMTAAVTVYTKPSCPQCTMTKKVLDKLGIEHDTVDVTADPEAHAYVTGLGYQQAPVVVVNGGESHWAGFSPDKLKGLVSGD